MPISSEVIPCTSNLVPRRGRKDITIVSGMTCLDLWFLPDGFQPDNFDKDNWSQGQTVFADGIVGYGMMPSIGGRAPLFGLVQQNATPEANSFMNLPVTAAANSTDMGLMLAPVDATWPTVRNSVNSFPQEARLVSAEVKISFSGRQTNIEGVKESLCTYETPANGETMDAYLEDKAYRTEVFDSRRVVTLRWWPNCETPIFRKLSAESTNPASTVTRWRAKLRDLAPGDKFRIEYVANYELVRPRALAMQTPSPIAHDLSALANAIPSHAGTNESLAHHVVAHKVMQHTLLSKIPHLANVALEIIGGSAVGAKLVSALRTAASTVGPAAELLAPLLV
jgi:hypothetical protein